MKKYINCAFLYAILAMIGGIFYREFTKLMEFTGKTTLSVVHTHYFVLGMLFFLILTLLEKNFQFTNQKTTKAVTIYQIGLNLTTIMFVVRGITQVLQTSLTTGANATISGIAGIGHILLSVGLIIILLQLNRAIQ
ncbi:MAG: DUF2871 domain-containing protein [Lachnospiraceae bacterium]|nr:DUF2871 domain-containing protein [Lachnospiraceae bacterium]